MSDPTTATLKRIVAQRHMDTGLGISVDEFFERYVPSQVMKDLDLSYEDIDSGVVDGGQDGGIDAFYTVLNGVAVSDDVDTASFKWDVTLQVHAFQTRLSATFKEAAVDRMCASLIELLDPGTDLDALQTAYNRDLLAEVGNFHRVYDALLTKHPRLEITAYYASTAPAVDNNVRRRANRFDPDIRHFFPDALVRFEFLTARDLLTHDSRSALPTLKLVLAEVPISTEGKGVIGLVRLSDFYNFITDETGHLRLAIFDSNVRDYQNQTEVNREIRNSLQNPLEDFWWLNNGVTIIATRSSQSSKTLTISDAQIVNGLQTSMEIYHHFSRLPEEERYSDSRTILVRILETSEEESRDRIITATNSQTRIPAASLRATHGRQREIEQHLAARGLYYDRRKNQQRNMGRPNDKIVSIPYLAQSVMAILLQRPDNSRARPSNIIKADEDYKRVFGESYPLDAFFNAAAVMKRIDEFMRSPHASTAAADKNNVKWHLAMFACASLNGTGSLSPVELASLDLSELTDEFLSGCLETVWDVYQQAIDRHGSPDRAAKSREMVETLKKKHHANNVV